EGPPGFRLLGKACGVCGRRVGEGGFVLGVLGGGPAERGGLRGGDQILTADGQPFSPVESFAGRAGKPVKLQVQRSQGASPISVLATPQSTRPHEELRQAAADSWQILKHKGRRIAYIHMWSWATVEFQQV